MTQSIQVDRYKYTAVCKNCGNGIKSVDKKTWVHGNYESLCPRTWAKPRGEA
jgi:hypothetical protein